MFELNEKDRIRLSNFIEMKYGIQMPPSKKILLQTRLQKRALKLGYNSIHGYIEYLFSSEGLQHELDEFATVVSTHKTDFFREPDHFTALKMDLLPNWLIDSILDTERRWLPGAPHHQRVRRYIRLP